MKNNFLLTLSFFLIPLIVNGQTQEVTTSFGKKIILNANSTWKYAEEATTIDDIAFFICAKIYLLTNL